MNLYRNQYRVESARWQTQDYGAPGWYFVTICAKSPFFGEIFRDGTMWLSETGCQAARCWAAIPQHFPQVVPDVFVVMPDHIHGIVAIASADPDEAVGPDAAVGPIVETRHVASLQGFGPLRRGSLPVVVGQYKSAVTRWARRNGASDFAWQAGYHDRVIRSERELENVRRYIAENPVRWCGKQGGGG
jgi:REP element-mobilizing transposase RayT